MQDENVSKLFKVGDLVQYTPHFQDPEGPWKMFGDLGVVVSVENQAGYQIIRVRWLTDSIELEMAESCLTKIDESYLTNAD